MHLFGYLLLFATLHYLKSRGWNLRVSIKFWSWSQIAIDGESWEGHVGSLPPLIMLIIEPRMDNKFWAHSPFFKIHVLDVHLTIHHSKLGVQL
jgi:hypothetical protein